MLSERASARLHSSARDTRLYKTKSTTSPCARRLHTDCVYKTALRKPIGPHLYNLFLRICGSAYRGQSFVSFLTNRTHRRGRDFFMRWAAPPRVSTTEINAYLRMVWYYGETLLHPNVLRAAEEKGISQKGKDYTAEESGLNCTVVTWQGEGASQRYCVPAPARMPNKDLPPLLSPRPPCYPKLPAARTTLLWSTTSFLFSLGKKGGSGVVHMSLSYIQSLRAEKFLSPSRGTPDQCASGAIAGPARMPHTLCYRSLWDRGIACRVYCTLYIKYVLTAGTSEFLCFLRG